MHCLVNDALLACLCRRHDFTEVAGNTPTQKGEDSSEHVQHLVRGEVHLHVHTIRQTGRQGDREADREADREGGRESEC